MRVLERRMRVRFVPPSGAGIPGRLRRLSGWLGVAVLFSTGAATPALAAGGSDDLARYRSTATAVRPAVDGLDVQVADDGSTVTVRSTSQQSVIILGYGDEPYLRFTPSGVDENTASVTSGVNTDGALTPLPASAGADARKVVARWVHRSDDPVFTWRDVRVGWTSPERPPVVAADPDAEHEVLTWGIPFTVDGQPGVVVGSLRWTASGSRWPLVVVAVLGLLGAAGWFGRRRLPFGHLPFGRRPSPPARLPDRSVGERVP